MGTFIELLKLFWTNREQLLAVFKILPDVLDAAGTGMVAAGGSAKSVGQFIGGGAGVSADVSQVFSASADALGTIQEKVEDAKDTLQDMVDNAFFLPVLPLMQSAKSQVNDVSTQVQNVVDQLESISSVFDSAGDELQTLGQELIKAGKQLQEAG